MIKLKNISFYIVISLLLNGIAILLDSNFLTTFLKNNLITLLVSLLAINTATNTLFLSKLDEIVKRFEEKGNKKAITYFEKTLKSAKENIYDQIWLVIIAIVILLILNSNIQFRPYISFSLNTVLISLFIYALDILRDTAKAIFQIVEISHNINSD